MAYPQAANIVFNLSAESLMGADGSAVSSWVDSVHSVNAAQATAGKQPLLYNNAIGTKKVVRFDGVDDVLSFTNAGSVVGSTIDSLTHTTLIVCQPVSAKSHGVMWAASSNANEYVFVADGNYIGQYGNTGTNKAAPTASRGFNVFALSNTSSSSSLAKARQRNYLNGSCYYEHYDIIPVTASNFFIGALDATSSIPSNVDIAAIIVWDIELTPTEVMQATAEAYSVYGQTVPWASGPAYFPVLDGNSIMNGELASNVAGRVPYLLAQSLSLSYGQWTSVAQSALAVSELANPLTIAEWSGIGAFVGKPVKVAMIEYYNSKSSPAADIETNTNAYCAAVRALPNHKLALCTSLSNATDPDATRDAFDAYYDANYAANCDAYIPCHLNAYLGIGGADGVNSYSLYSGTYWADTIHPNDAGNAIFAGLIVDGLNAIVTATGYVRSAMYRFLLAR